MAPSVFRPTREQLRHGSEPYPKKPFVKVVGCNFATVVSALPSTREFNLSSACGIYGSKHDTSKIFRSVSLTSRLIVKMFCPSAMVRSALSWSPFTALSKLVFSQYLVHMALQLMQGATIRSPQQFNFLNMVRSYFNRGIGQFAKP